MAAQGVATVMGGLFGFFTRLGFGKRSERLSAAEAEELRAAFRARYHNFKLLLSANNKALEIMADLEAALRGGRPFGMSFIRAQCTAVSVNVYRIVQSLTRLAPHKYDELLDRFKLIQEEINSVLSRRRGLKGSRLVLPLGAVDREMTDEVGSKMANVAEVKNRIGLRVPGGFVITSLAYRRFFEHNDLQTEIDRILQSSETETLDALYAMSADIQQRIIRASVPEDLERAILEAHAALEREAGAGVKVSLRSSALGEDTAQTSFAGQYRSELNVSADNLLQSYKEIVASKYSLQAISYRLNRGILDEDVAMCVGCMAMVNAVSGGVTYSRNPLDIRDESVVINAVWGLPKSVVDGSVGADTFIVGRSAPLAILRREIVPKEHKFVCYPDEGVCRMDLTGEKSLNPSLTDAQALELAETALRLEAHYGPAQDIEWAIDSEGRLFILQCRPLKQLAAKEAGRAADRAESPVLLEGGATASPGVASGPVFVVRKNSDTLQFPEGAVLVVPQALPRTAALLSRAVAVVTEQGSVAGHLANVAREFGVPALFGVSGAIERLENGRIITVDADGLRIYPGRVEALLGAPRIAANLMAGSPVHAILTEVSERIIPLTLLDPESICFRPSSCVTLHDITRFCHEKAVKEMFNFGKEHHFSERASKQLVCDVPMLWWIINLDDGFREDVGGKFVELSNIDCIPMLALWEGITAVAWQGPPPVDTRGFMSVLLEASANPALDPSMPSHYTNRNYFMISRNFCSLNSRFGFHFLTVETLVGERASENYISFQFKGGAADYSRRLRRARFVADILEEYAFRAELKEDGVFARIEGYEEPFMKERLRILGYLLIHTRQLDMIMSNDDSLKQYWEKFMSDIAQILNSAEGHADVVP